MAKARSKKVTNTPAGRSKALGKTPVFDELSADVLKSVAAAASVQTLSKGKVLIAQGDRERDLHVLVDGALDVVATDDSSGDETSIAELSAPALVGEMQTLTGGVRSATVRTSTPSTVITVPGSAVDDFPDLLVALHHHAHQRMRLQKLREVLASRYHNVESGVLEFIEARVQWRALARGETLMEQGDPSDSVYFLISGGLDVIKRRPDGSVAVRGSIAPGESVGESALLANAVRGATVRAARGTVLAELSATDFMEIAERNPALLFRAIEAMAARQQRNAGDGPARMGARTVAFVPVGSSPASYSLAKALARTALPEAVVIDRAAVTERFDDGDLADVSADDPRAVRLSTWFEQLQETEELVIYEADRVGSTWATHCIANADEVVLVANARSARADVTAVESALLEPIEGLQAARVTLAVLQERRPPYHETARWLEGRSIDLVLHVHHQSEADLGRLGRFLTDRAVGVVFSGGAALSFTGLGLVRALEEQGIPVDAVAGVSMGAIAATAVASGLDAEQSLKKCLKVILSVRPDVTLPVVSMMKSGSFLRALRKAFGNIDIVDLPIPCFYVSTNMTRADQRVSDRGELARHLLASNAAPGIMPPIAIDGDLHVDGALMNNLPSAEMAQVVRGGYVVAVDVSPTVEVEEYASPGDGLSGFKVAFDWIRHNGKQANMPSMLSILLRTQLLHHADKIRAAREQADLCIVPDMSGYLIVDYHRGSGIAQKAYEQAVEPVRQWWASVSGAATE